jgi:excisionase family DNA binding protein
MSFNVKDGTERRFYSLEETAAMLGVSRQTLENWWRRGTLRTVKIGGRRLVPAIALDELDHGAPVGGDA